MADITVTIDKLLKAKGITGAKMCADLGMSRSFMTELRKGRAKGIKAETANKIANYLGVSVSYLLGEEEQKNITPSKQKLTEGEEMILKLFRQIPEDKQAAAIELLRAALKMK